jgi:hypothetical protein
MAVNFLTLRSAVANDMAVQHLTYSTMAGHPTASHQTVQAIMTSSIITSSHVGIGTTVPVAGTALNVVGSTMISGNVTIDNGTTGQFIKNGSTAGYNMNINGGNSTNSPNVDFYSAGTRKMYVGNANTTDTFIYAENGVKLNLGTNGVQRIYINTDGDVDVSSRELRVSQLNGNGQVRLKSGNRQQSAIFHCNDDWFYFLATDNGNWLSGYNAIRPIRYNLTSGAVVMENGATINGGATVNSGLTGSEVYTNGWFRVNTSGGLYWQSYGRGIQAADSAGASYGNVSVYGTGINTWNGYDINGRYTFMANGDTVGVHDRNHSWVWYNVNGTMYINKRLIVNGTSIEDRLAALEAKVYSIMPLDGYIRAGPDFYISIRGMGGQQLRYVNISAAAVASGQFYAYGYRDI